MSGLPPATPGADLMAGEDGRSPFDRAKWPLVVVLGVLLANLPALIGLVDVNPLALVGRVGSVHLAGYLPGRSFFDPNIGYTSQALGHLAAVDWLHGIVPWWNPYEGLGAPLAGEMQSAALFPPTLLLAVPHGQLYFHVCLELTAGLSTWFLVRELGLGEAVAAVGGIMFALNGTLAIFGNAPANPVAFLPLALLGVERIGRREDWDWSGCLILAIAIALSIYAGFPETAYLGGLLIAVWIVYRLASAPARRRARIALQAGGGVVTGLLLAAPLLVAFGGYLPYAAVGGHAGSLGRGHLLASAANLLGLPWLYGPIGYFNNLATVHISRGGGFVGASAIAAAGIGIVSGARSDRGIRALLGSVVVVVVAWNYGFPPVQFVLEHVVPFVHDVADDIYSAPVVELCVVLLACWGLAAIAEDAVRRRALLIVGAFLALAVVGVDLLICWPTVVRLYHASTAYLRYPIWMAAWATGVVLVIGLAAVLLKNRRIAAIVTGAALVIDSLAMFVVPELSAPRSVAVDLRPVSYLAAHIGDSRVYTLGYLQPNYGSYYGIAELDVNDLPVPKLWQTFVRSLDRRFRALIFDGNGRLALTNLTAMAPAYEAVGVRYVVAPRLLHLFPRGVTRAGGVVRVVYEDSTAAIYELPRWRPYFSTRGGTCSLRVESRSSVATKCAAPARLAMSQLDLPGWSATVNGHSAEVTRTGRYFVSVAVPAGKSQVAFSYLPPHELIGIGLFGLGVATCLALVGVPYWRTRRRRSRRPEEADQGPRSHNGARTSSRLGRLLGWNAK